MIRRTQPEGYGGEKRDECKSGEKKHKEYGEKSVERKKRMKKRKRIKKENEDSKEEEEKVEHTLDNTS